MTLGDIPPAEAEIDVDLVRALLRDQHPDIAELPLVDVGSGWDNQMYRLGNELVVRLPRRGLAAPLIEHEQQWMATIAARLPLPIPVPSRRGIPGRGYPWSWSVAPWLSGESAAFRRPSNDDMTAMQLGSFLSALHQPGPADAPRNAFKGVPLADRSDAFRRRVTQLDGLIDAAAVLACWEAAVRVPVWSGAPLWIHGDLHPGNLLVKNDRISAVIDFGDLTAGDPATDLAIAWMLLPPSARTTFRQAARQSGDAIDDDTWARARGWALADGIAHLSSARDNEAMARVARLTIQAVVEDLRT